MCEPSEAHGTSPGEVPKYTAQKDLTISNRMIEPVAIRSLQCADHAQNIPPTVLSVQWFVGKRCNYDCTYCSPHIHDQVSDFLDLPKMLDLICGLQVHAQSQGKKIKWTITGGEPFLDPSLLSAVGKIHQHEATEQINITTNGSLKFSLYSKFLPYLKGITVSLHPERTLQEIEKTMDTVVKIQQDGRCFVSVNLMCMPGRLDWAKAVRRQLESTGIPYVARRIHPPMHQPDLLPWIENSKKRKDRVLLDQNQQAQNKIQWKIMYDNTQQQNHSNYYNQNELDFITEANQNNSWNNIGVWTKQSEYSELNTDSLVQFDQNRFFGWQCWSGVDSLYIDYDRQIYRGMCMEGGVLESGKFAQEPITCSRHWCHCNVDIAVRKCKSSAQHNLIT